MEFKARYQYDPQKDLIGRGGFARVYRATDVLLDRVVAIKFYINQGDNSHTLIKEIGRAIKLEHPNLCRYYDAAVLQSVNFHGETEIMEAGVMEYLDGGNISTYLMGDSGARNKLLVDILHGLQYLHENIIIHRDIKPSNILIKKTPAGPVAKISDFGISKNSGLTTTKSSDLMGTIAYMAPEQFNSKKYGINEKISTNLDLWSWGCLAYEVITGDSLFASHQTGASTEQILINILHENYEDKIAALPSPFNEAVQVCLVKNANERVRNASDVLKILQGNTTTKKTTPAFDTEITRVLTKDISAEKIPIPVNQEQPIESPHVIKPIEVKKEKPASEKKVYSKKTIRVGVIAGIMLIILVIAFFTIKGMSGSSHVKKVKSAVRKNIEALNAHDTSSFVASFAADAALGYNGVVIPSMTASDIAGSFATFVKSCPDYTVSLDSFEITDDSLVNYTVKETGSFIDDYLGVKVMGLSFTTGSRLVVKLDNEYKIRYFEFKRDGLTEWMDGIRKIELDNSSYRDSTVRVEDSIMVMDTTSK